jgi:hypothetical protein
MCCVSLVSPLENLYIRNCLRLQNIVLLSECILYALKSDREEQKISTVCLCLLLHYFLCHSWHWVFHFLSEACPSQAQNGRWEMLDTNSKAILCTSADGFACFRGNSGLTYSKPRQGLARDKNGTKKKRTHSVLFIFEKPRKQINTWFHPIFIEPLWYFHEQ